MLNRRTFLAVTGCLPFATTPLTAQASAPMLGASTNRYQRVIVGKFEVTTLLSAARTVSDPQKIFGLNVSEDEFAQASEAANIPTDKARFYFTPTVVNTGKELILFDTGLNSDDIASVLADAGYGVDQIDVVVITHMHPDHIGGLMNGGVPTFSNARYVTGTIEFDAWARRENPLFDNNMRPLAEKTEMLDPKGSVASGITALKAFGHTPGHMAYLIESEGKSLILGADFANHYVWSLAYPDWEVKFDMDKPMAAATRRRLLDMMATDRIPFIGYHMPWPATGFVEARDEGFRYVPASYQLTL